MRIIFISLLIFSVVSCKETSDKKISQIIDETDDIVLSTLQHSSKNKYITLDTFIWQNDTASVAVIYDNKTPIQVAYWSEITLDDEWTFFLDRTTGEPIYFFEIRYSDIENKHIENQFYYRNGEFIKGQTSVVDYDNPGQRADKWQDYNSTNNDDFRLNPLAVNQLVNEIIKAVEADKTYLSPQANAARKQGAIFWASSGNDEWAVSIYPDNHIDFEFDFGKQKLEYRSYEESFDDFGIIYSAEMDEKEFEIKFLIDSCTSNKDGYGYPFTVNVKFDNKQYSGCGTYF